MKRPALLISLVAAAWLAGFLWFAHDALRPAPPPPHADGIVVLTGGAERIAAALRLLSEGRAERLLISGVNARIALPQLARGTGIDARMLADRVTLGRNATDTLGNAAETAGWARAHDMHALIVVTAGYHMRRAMTEIARDLPGVTLYPAPVVPPALRRLPFSGLRVLIAEYLKWLAASVGVSRMLG